jgi:hypothetical protein
MTRVRLQASAASAVTLSLWLWHRGFWPATLAAIATALALVAWLSPVAYKPVARVLDGFAHTILTAFTWLALGLVYFGVFTPLRLWHALRRHDPLARAFDPAATTYLRPLPQTPPRFDRQF